MAEEAKMYDYIESMESTLCSELDQLYPEADNIETRSKIIENGCKLASQITEARKVQSDVRKTDIEAALKDGMNIRDNKTKERIAEMEIKEKRIEMYVNSGLTTGIILLNTVKVLGSVGIWCVSIFTEGSGMVVETSKSAKKAFDIGKSIISKVV